MSLLLFGASEGEAVGSFVHADANGANVTTLTGVTWGTAGAATQSGDVAVLAWTFINTETPTDPTSETWTLVGTVDDGSCRSRLLKRVCDGTESGDITGWSTTGAGNRQSAVLYVVRGYSDVAGAVSFAETVTGTSHDCPSIGTGDGAAGGDSILVAVAERVSTGTTNATAPSGFTEHTGSEFGTGGSGGTYTGVADDGLATSQTMPFDPGAWTGMVSSGTAVTWTLALRPSSSGATVTPAATATTVAAPQATAAVSDTAEPAVTTTTVSAPQATPSVSDTGAPAVTTATVALAQATISADATVTPASISAAVTLPFSDRNVGAGPGVLVAVATLPQATPEAGGNTTVAPAAIAAPVSVPAAVPSAAAAVAPVVLVVVVSTPQATPQGAANTTPGAIVATVAAPAALPTVHDTAAPATIAALVALAQTAPLGGAVVTPDAIVVVVTLPLPHLTEPRDIVVIARLRSDHVTGSVGSSDLVAGLRSSHITGGVDVPRNMLTGSVEYVTAEVTFVGETAAGIATVIGQIQITSDDTVPSSWASPDAEDRTNVNGGAMLALKKLHTAGAPGEYRVWAKLTDNPEVPILKCGSFTVR